ncbi:MAG: hypothetical protein WAqPseu_26680 [Shewanella algae]
MVRWSHLQRFVKPELWICNYGEGKEQLIVGSFLAESPRIPGTSLGERSYGAKAFDIKNAKIFFKSLAFSVNEQIATRQKV